MTTEQQIAEIEQNIRNAGAFVAQAAALDRLRANRDFQSIVLTGYFKDEAVRLVQLKADPLFQTPERQQSIVAQIDAIGALNQYFQAVQFNANQASKAIAADNEAIDELRAEGLTHD